MNAIVSPVSKESRSAARVDLWRVLEQHVSWLEDPQKGQRADLAGADLSGQMMIGADLRRADLRGVDLSRANLNEARLSEADLTGANLRGACLGCVDLSGARLVGADLSQANLCAAILDHVQAMGAVFCGANLSHRASLVEADLRRADLRRCDLNRACLCSADLDRADLRAADLSEAELDGARAAWADFRFADLKAAALVDADLTGANFADATLDFARFENAQMQGVEAADCRTLFTEATTVRLGGESFTPPDGRLDGWLENRAQRLVVRFSRPLSSEDLEAARELASASGLRLDGADFRARQLVLTGGGEPGAAAREFLRRWHETRVDPAIEGVQTPEGLVQPTTLENPPEVPCPATAPEAWPSVDSWSVRVRVDGKWSRPEATIEEGSGALWALDQRPSSAGGERRVRIGLSTGDTPEAVIDEVALRLRLFDFVSGFVVQPEEFPVRRYDLGASNGLSLSSRGPTIFHDPGTRRSLLVGAWSRREPAQTFVHVRDGAVIVSTVLSVEARLQAGEELEVSSQWLLPVSGDLEQALASVGAWMRAKLHHRASSETEPAKTAPSETAPTETVPPKTAPTEIHPVLYAAHPGGTLPALRQGKIEGFDRLTHRLESISRLGADVLWLLPIYECEMPAVYSLWDHDLLESGLGGEAACRMLVGRAQQLGLEVLFDLVPHGPLAGSQLHGEHPEWVCLDRDGAERSRWGCLALDYANESYQAWLCGVAERLLTRFGADGFRIDCADGSPANWRSGLPHRASDAGLGGGLRLIARLRDELGGRHPNLRLFAEADAHPLFLESGDWVLDPHFLRVVAAWNEATTPGQWVEDLKDWLTARDLTAPRPDALVRCLETPDTVSLERLVGSRLRLPFWALLAFSRCVPLLYEGQESDLEVALEHLFAVRRSSAALRQGTQRFEGLEVSPLGEGSASGVLVFRRESATESLLVVIDFAGEDRTLRISDLEAGQSFEIDVPAFGWQVLEAGEVVASERPRGLGPRPPEREVAAGPPEAAAQDGWVLVGQRRLLRRGDFEMAWQQKAGGRLQALVWRGLVLACRLDLEAEIPCEPNPALDDSPGPVLRRHRQSLDLEAEVCELAPLGVRSQGTLTHHGPTRFGRQASDPPWTFDTTHRFEDSPEAPTVLEISTVLTVPDGAAIHSIQQSLELPLVQGWALGSESAYTRRPLTVEAPSTLRLSGPELPIGFYLETLTGRCELKPAPGGHGATLTLLPALPPTSPEAPDATQNTVQTCFRLVMQTNLGEPR